MGVSPRLDDAAVICPVRVAIIRTHKNFRKRSEARQEMPPHLVELLSSRGFQTADIAIVHSSNWDWRPRQWSWPRNLEWNSFPRISEARFKQSLLSLRPYEAGDDDKILSGLPSTMKYWSSKPIDLSGVELVILPQEFEPTPMMRDFLSLWDHMPEDRAPAICWLRDEDLVEVPRHDVESLRRDFEPQERFVWNHVLQSVVLCSRAMYVLYHEANRDVRYLKEFFPRLDCRTRWYIGHPLALQILYLLRREADGKVPPPKGPYLRYDEKWNALMEGASFLKWSDDREKCVFRWVGSGRYPTWECEFSHNPVSQDTFGFRYFETTPPLLRDISSVISGLLLQHLTHIGDDRKLYISQTGLRFLDLIGSEMDDPDMLLRWKSGGPYWGTQKDIKAMDRWLNKGFRSVKRRVSSLPPSPFSESSSN